MQLYHVGLYKVGALPFITGLPHAHILLWLKQKMRADNVDDVIRAEIPDPVAEPDLFQIIKSHMVHGPCGEYNLMEKNKCSKR